MLTLCRPARLGDAAVIAAGSGSGSSRAASSLTRRRLGAHGAHGLQGPLGVHEKHGKLGGVWRDCVVMERLIPENVT